MQNLQVFIHFVLASERSPSSFINVRNVVLVLREQVPPFKLMYSRVTVINMQVAVSSKLCDSAKPLTSTFNAFWHKQLTVLRLVQ